MATIDVIIVGAGPVGLLSAIHLTKLGLTVRVFEKSPEPMVIPRAIGFVPRTMEILDRLDVSGPLHRDSVVHDLMHVYANGVKIKSTASYSNPTSRYGGFLCYSCGDACRNFTEVLEGLGVQVEYGKNVIDIDIDGEGVWAILRNLDDTDTAVHGKYLIGADGAKSLTRRKLGFIFEGKSEDIPSISLDSFIETDFPDKDGMNFMRNEHGTLFVCAKPNGAIRFSGERKQTDANDFTADSMLETTLENFRKILAPFKVEFKEVEWFGSWNVNECVSQDFCKAGKVFLAGDSAHTHTPAGALGMNGGIADAFNIAWKIYLVHTGVAKPLLLETYDNERRLIAETAIRISGALVRLYSANPVKAGSPGMNSTVARELASIMARNQLSFCGMLDYDPNVLNLKDSDITLAFSTEFTAFAGRRAPDAFVKKLDPYKTTKKVYLMDEAYELGMFTLIFMPGSLSTDALDMLSNAQRHIESPESFVNSFKVKSPRGLFRILTVIRADIPNVSEIVAKSEFLSNYPVYEDVNDETYSRFGIAEGVTAVFAVRPDGYVGAAVMLEDFTALEDYFDGFLNRNAPVK